MRKPVVRIFTLFMLISLLPFMTHCQSEEPMVITTPIPEGVEIVKITESKTTTSQIEQKKEFDQCDASSSFKTAVKFSQFNSNETQQELVLKASGGVEGGISKIANGMISVEINQHFVSIQKIIDVHAEMANIEVPANTKQEYTIVWNETRREGSLEYIEDGAPKTANYSYRIGLEFISSKGSDLPCETPEANAPTEIASTDPISTQPPTEPPTPTPIPQTATPMPTQPQVPTNTPLPPPTLPAAIDTPMPPTQPPAPTNTPLPPPTLLAPTNTPVPPTQPPVPTSTSVPTQTSTSYRERYSTSVGTGGFANVFFSDGMAEYGDQHLTASNGRIQQMNISITPTGCGIAAYPSSRIWFDSTLSTRLSINGEVIGEYNQPGFRARHGTILNWQVYAGDQICIELSPNIKYLLNIGPDVDIHYDSYCFRGYC